jgi:hypothetical protein
MVGRRDLITPNPKLKLLDQVREVMRLKHYSIRTEKAYCDWIRRYVKFHGMQSREELEGAGRKVWLIAGRSGLARTLALRVTGLGNML